MDKRRAWAWFHGIPVTKGSSTSGNFAHRGRPKKRGGSAPGGGHGGIGIAAGASASDIQDTVNAHRERQAARAEGRFPIEKTGRNTWKVGEFEVEVFSTKDPRYHFQTNRKKLGVVRRGGQEIDIIADRPWEDGKQLRITAAQRDAVMQEAIMPTLAQVPPEHLEGLQSIRFNSVVNARATATYKPISSRFEEEAGGTGWIEFNAWQEYVNRGNAKGMVNSLKHEIGHHVWENTLTSKERLAYVNGLGINVSSPKQVTYRDYDLSKLRPITQTPIRSAPMISGYGNTNAFEDFAEFYMGWNALSRRMDRTKNAMRFWDQSVNLGEFTKEAFNFRRRILPMEKING